MPDTNQKEKPNNISKKISFFSMLFLIALAIFLYGLKVGKSKIAPYQFIDDAHRAAISLIRFGEIIQTNRLIEAPDYVSREPFYVYDQALVQPGYYAFMGYNGQQNKYMAWLINAKGETLHSWDIFYDDLNKENLNHQSTSDRFISPHAFKVLEDASLLVSFDSGNLMARIDQCSNPVWIKSGVFHHSIERAGDGSFWTWRGSESAYGHFNYLTNFDPESGETIREIGLVEDIIQANYDEAVKFGFRDDYPFKAFVNKQDSDLFHPNDIDILSPEMASQFPNFKAGDLLISLRNTHLVAVIDPDNKKIKWSSNGPWRYQHDPDFTSDGFISVYNNNTDGLRSEIIKIHPATYHLTNDLKNGNLYFYSETQGKHQYLPNGNLLIVIPDEGRAVQVTANGDKVFELNNISRFSNKYNEHLANGIWLSPKHFKKATKVRCK